MSNATLMTTIATGTRAESDAAFAELVDAWQGKITGYAHKMLRDWGQAEDVFQSVMLTVFQHSGNFREIGKSAYVSGDGTFSVTGEGSSFSNWMYSITHRRCIDVIRKRRNDALSHRVSPTDDFDPTSTIVDVSRSPIDAIVEREELDEIAVAMEAIPNDQRAVLELFQEGFSFGEIADASGKPVPTVKSQARLAREKLAGVVNRNRMVSLIERMFA